MIYVNEGIEKKLFNSALSVGEEASSLVLLLLSLENTYVPSDPVRYIERMHNALPLQTFLSHFSSLFAAFENCSKYLI